MAAPITSDARTILVIAENRPGSSMCGTRADRKKNSSASWMIDAAENETARPITPRYCTATNAPTMFSAIENAAMITGVLVLRSE